MKFTHTAAMIAAITLSCVTPALANDAVFGGAGSDLVPIKQKNLKMVSEDIVIEEVGKKNGWKYDHWEITATYTFENPTDQSITTQFGFPERMCDPESDCNSKKGGQYTFFNMKTTVNGKRVKVKVGEVSSESSWAPELGRVHLFDVTIPAKKKTTVVHKYQMGLSGSFMQETELLYVTKTGALWNGPIGSARFTIRTKQRPWGFGFPKTYNLESFTTKREGKKARTEIVFAMKDWTPTQDLTVVLGADYMPFKGCPSPLMFVDTVYDHEDKLDIERAKKELEELSTAQLRQCRNLVYARHGYTFKDKKLGEFFYEHSKPTAAKETKWGYNQTLYPPEDYKVLIYKQNLNYTPDMLTERDSKWVKAFKAVEKSRKVKKK